MRPTSGRHSTWLLSLNPRSIRGWGAILLLLLSYGIAGAVRTTIVYTAPTVTTSDAQALAANISRNYLYLQNNDTTAANIIFCKFGATAVVNQGLRLEPSAGSSGARLTFDGKVPTAALRCISGAGSPVLLIGEGVGP